MPGGVRDLRESADEVMPFCSNKRSAAWRPSNSPSANASMHSLSRNRLKPAAQFGHYRFESVLKFFD